MFKAERGAVKARTPGGSPAGSPARSTPREGGLPRSPSSYSLLPGAGGLLMPPSLWDRLQRHRLLRLALILLVGVVFAANIAWVGGSTLSAWQRGSSGWPRSPTPLLQRNATYSAELSELDGETGGTVQPPETDLVKASGLSIADGRAALQQQQQQRLGQQALAAPAVPGKDEEGDSEEASPSLLGQLKGLGGVISGALHTAAGSSDDGSSSSSGRGGKAGAQDSDSVTLMSTGSRREALPAKAAAAAAAATAAALRAQQAAAREGAATGAPQAEQKADLAALPAIKQLPRTPTVARAGNLWIGKTASGPPPGLAKALPASAKPANSSSAAPAPSPLPAPPPHRAVLAPAEVATRSPDTCAQALNSSKVALMLLTKGDLFHEPVWKLWFESAAGKLPKNKTWAAACGADQGRWQQVQRACLSGPAGNSSSGIPDDQLVDAQHLFSVYIHAPPNITDADLPPLFKGRLIRDRLTPDWGTHQLVEATRNLLWEAYRDPLNTRFVLLSESDIPLYDPLTFWQQLQAERRSRVNACPGGHTMPWRWSWRMSTKEMKQWHWRKSSQWIELLREHVEVVLRDEEYFRKFEQWCWNGWDKDYKRWRDCFSDEHYIPTLLAVKRLSAQTVCDGLGVSHTDWSAGGPHPKSYRPWEVRSELIQKARASPNDCHAAAAIQDAQRMFVRAAELAEAVEDEGGGGPGAACTREDLLALPVPTYDNPLPGNCTLTSRKFPKATVQAVQRLFLDCDDGSMHLLDDGVCRRAAVSQRKFAWLGTGG